MSSAFGSVNGGKWQKVTQIGSSAAGKSRLQNPDGTIVSVQPDGTVESRPDGSDGAYEQCVVSNGVVTFNPVDGLVYPFGIAEA